MFTPAPAQSNDRPIFIEDVAQILEKHIGEDSQSSSDASGMWCQRRCEKVPEDDDADNWSTASPFTAPSISRNSIYDLPLRNASISPGSEASASVIFRRSMNGSGAEDSPDSEPKDSSSLSTTPSNKKIIDDIGGSSECSPVKKSIECKLGAFQYRPPEEDNCKRRVICKRKDVHTKNKTVLRTRACLHYHDNDGDSVVTPWVSRSRIMTNFDDDRRNRNLSYLADEKNIHEPLNHKNIARFLGCHAKSDENDLELVFYTDYCGRHPYKILKGLPASKRGEHILDWAGQLIEALTYLHSRQILHRDIKPSNLAIDSTGRLRVFDFGLAKNLREGFPTDKSGSPMYMSPEARARKQQNKNSDLYSYGQTLLRICVHAEILIVNYPRNPAMVLPVIGFHKTGDHKLEHRKLRRIIDGVNLAAPFKRDPLIVLRFLLSLQSTKTIAGLGPPVAGKTGKGSFGVNIE